MEGINVVSLPKYQQLAATMRKRIKEHAYAPKSLLPDQNTLAKEFGVSRLTIKKALDGLAQEGLIYKQSGVGTVVLGIALENGEDSPAERFDGLTKLVGSAHVRSKILKFDITFPSPKVQKQLVIGPDDPVYDIRRLRLIDGEPWIIEHTYFRVKMVPNLTHKILEHSIYAYINNDLHLKFGGAYRRIGATLTTQEDIDNLGGKAGEPVLQVEQVVWLTTGQNIEYSISRNLARNRSYTVLDINQN
ncbi:GntR family transcriptional regulator [Lacticaseibacillus yichunensis]|uniref:GntR family transcriptional regulator n=1 Tax=Lacticaseibacillus yichunensis TaxID=2486015 RepID=UPI001CDCEB92|nr:GntR family transcriptional regulator [Lacticaseibacillus yichunensis]